MATTIDDSRPPNKTEWQADRRIYLDKDGNVVEHNDPKKLSLLVAAGGFLPIEVAERHGLLKVEAPKADAEAEAKTAKRPPRSTEKK